MRLTDMTHSVSVRVHLDGDDTVVVVSPEEPDQTCSGLLLRAVPVLDDDSLRDIRRDLHHQARYVLPGTEGETLYLL